MFAERAIELIKEVHRTKDNLAAYNNDLVTQVSKEIKSLVEENHANAQTFDRELGGGLSTIRVRHAGIQRNMRCLLAYHYNRLRCLRQMRWEFGSVLPPDIKANISSSESVWLNKYSASLAKYMRTIGDEGMNLGVDLKPPKSLFIQVNCLVDYGKYQLRDGSVISLQKDSLYYLPRSDCEELIRLKIFEHVA